MESDEDDPSLYEGAIFDDDDDDAQVVEGAVEDTSDELGEGHDGDVVVEEVTTIEGVPVEGLGQVLEGDDDQNSTTSNAVEVEESTETVTVGVPADGDEKADQHDNSVEEAGGDDEQIDEAVETVEAADESIAKDIDNHQPVDINEESVEQVEVDQSIHNEQLEPSVAAQLDEDPSNADHDGNNDSQIDAGVVEATGKANTK